MRVDITSMFFNSTIEGQTATAAWATSIAKQSKPCLVYENQECANIINGMLFCSKSDKENLSIKGMSSTRELIMFSIFDKVKANGKRIDGSFILLLVREHSASHDGRILLSYPMYAQYQDDNIFVSNEETKNKIANSIGCSNEGCWFVYDISIENQDTLCFEAKVVDPNNSKVYKVSSKERSKEWKELIGEPDKDSGLGDGEPLQQIFYGAPGTGKSHGIKEKKGDFSKVIRTTFHPDSDYSTFVGAYKPTMEESEVKVTPVVINNGISLDQNNGTYKEKRITYTFVKQAFLKAYIEAWNRHDKGENVLLVIEEINRGNCAQIFGDLFQLLDRNDEGFSDYPIQADEDLRKVLADEFANLDNIPENVKSGEELLLPNNLHIWATMNTSDQSLFPIDSAFKRRWDWKYVPIDTAKESWVIKVNGKEYSWTSFLNIINEKIYAKTQSEDKQLGFYFCKAEGDVISAERLVSKVLFYVYNDVFKDYGFDDSFFNSDNGKLTFQGYYKTDGKINEEKVAMFLDNLEAEGIRKNVTED